MTAPRWKGSQKMQEQPTSPEIVYNGDVVTATVVYRGPWDVMVANVPERGSRVTGLPNNLNLKVDKAVLKKVPGRYGEMTLSLTQSTTTLIPGGSTQEAPEYEIDWTQVEKPIENHPRYRTGKNLDGSGVGKEPFAGLSVAFQTEGVSCFDKVKQYFEETSIEKRAVILDAVSVYPLITELIEKKEKGIESFLTFAPVVRKTTTVYLPYVDSASKTTPTVGKCGFRQAPTVFAKANPPTGYNWLKTADRYHRKGDSGPWQRVEEWTGGEEVDVDLYPKG